MLCINYLSLSSRPNKFITFFTMNEGTIKFFNEAKGFGFITPNDGGSDVFVHVTGLEGQVRENDKVTYSVEEGRRGLTAVNVKVVG